MKEPNWRECEKKCEPFSTNYALKTNERKAVFDVVSTLPFGSTVVELGVCNGKTACMLAYVATCKDMEYYGIDKFFLENNKETVSKMLDSAEVKYNIIEGWTNEVPWDKPIDLLLIDASHTVPYIQQDCEKWLPFIKEGGYVAFHDYDHVYSKDSPHWAVRYYADMYTENWKRTKDSGDMEIRQKIIVGSDFRTSYERGT